MKDIEIKRVETKDADFLSELAVKAYTDHYLHLWHDEGKWYIKKYLSAEKLATELNDVNAQFYIAFFNNTPAGFLKLNIDAPLKGCEGKNSLELERIYLSREAAAKGIGRKLAALTFEIAVENKKDLVWLKAMDTSEGAISFYEKMGFTITGTLRLKHPLMKEELRGMVIMTKTLREQ